MGMYSGAAGNRLQDACRSRPLTKGLTGYSQPRFSAKQCNERNI